MMKTKTKMVALGIIIIIVGIAVGTILIVSGVKIIGNQSNRNNHQEQSLDTTIPVPGGTVTVRGPVGEWPDGTIWEPMWINDRPAGPSYIMKDGQWQVLENVEEIIIKNRADWKARHQMSDSLRNEDPK
jgi:hypothetical protein